MILAYVVAAVVLFWVMLWIWVVVASPRCNNPVAPRRNNGTGCCLRPGHRGNCR